MNLSSFQQIDISELPGCVDAVIAASGYESRATFLAHSLTGIGCHQLIAVAFDDRRVLYRERNDRRFRKLGYELPPSRGDQYEVVDSLVRDVLGNAQGDHVSIVVDYSCMTRVWYSAILRVLASEEDFGLEGVDVYFSYSPARFTRPRLPAPNAYMGPIPGFCHLDVPNKKGTALVIGLGYERDRALGLKHYLDAAENYAFYTDPALDQKFVSQVCKSNKDLMDELHEDRLFRYPAGDLHATSALLASVCVALGKQHRVIVAPLGPKPFSLLCLLLAIQLDELDVWRVSPGEQSKPSDRPPLGELLICRVSFLSDTSPECAVHSL